MMPVYCPTLNIPSCITITRDIYHLYVYKNVKLKSIPYKYMSRGVCDNRSMDFTSKKQLDRCNYPCFIMLEIIDTEFYAIPSHKGDDIVIILEIV